MGLSGILDIVQESPTYQEALATLSGATNGAGPLRITVPDAARSYLIACLCRDLHRTVLLVTAKPGDADRLSDDLTTIFSHEESEPQEGIFPVLRLPESEALPYERLAEDAQVSHGRLNVLSALLQQKESPPSGGKQPPDSDHLRHMGQGLALVGSGPRPG